MKIFQGKKLKNLYTCSCPISTEYKRQDYNQTWKRIHEKNDQESIIRTMQRMDERSSLQVTYFSIDNFC